MPQCVWPHKVTATTARAQSARVRMDGWLWTTERGGYTVAMVPVALLGDAITPAVVEVRFTVNVSLAALAEPAQVLITITAVLSGATKTVPLVGATSTPPPQLDPVIAVPLLTKYETVAAVSPPACWMVKAHVLDRAHDTLVDPLVKAIWPGAVPMKTHCTPFQK